MIEWTFAFSAPFLIITSWDFIMNKLAIKSITTKSMVPKYTKLFMKTNLADLSMNHYLSNYLDFTQSAPHTNEYQF